MYYFVQVLIRKIDDKISRLILNIQAEERILKLESKPPYPISIHPASAHSVLAYQADQKNEINLEK